MGKAIWASVLLLAAIACTSLRPQTGEISFRLLWDGKADLDLHVVDPGGGHTGIPFMAAAARDPQRYAQLQAEMVAGKNLEGKSAGIIDIDCNADTERVCPNPMENIFWPIGKAPRGSYQVWVELFQQVEGSGEVPYVLEIRRGEKVTQRIAGSVSQSKAKSEVVEYPY